MQHNSTDLNGCALNRQKPHVEEIPIGDRDTDGKGKKWIEKKEKTQGNRI